MASLNHVTLIGRLTAAPEMRYTPSGKAVANFDLAVERRKSGDREKETDFIPVVVVCIVGSLRTRTYEKDGQKRKAFEILCNEMQMLGSKDDGQKPSGQAKPGPKSAATANWSSDGFGDVGLEDIPF